MSKIICACGFQIYDGLTLKVRVAQFGNGSFNVKCKICKMWLNGLSIKYLTGEIKEDYIVKR